MTSPIVYNPMATATLNAGSVIQTQQLEILSRPLDGFVEGRNYRLNDVMSSLPVGPLRNTASLLAGSPDTMITMRLAMAADGSVTPQYLFRQAGDIPFEGPFVRVGNGGGPPAEPIPGGSLAVTLGGSAILIGTNVFLAQNDVPAPVIGPFVGGTYALADVGGRFFTAPSARVPAAPLNQFLNQGLTSMGVGTTVQYGWSYAFDALGTPMGSDANTYGSIGGTLLTFAPAINSPLNPVYSPTFANAFRSAIGVGLTGAGEGSYVFLAKGGWAGGAGWSGGAMQGLGAAGAVIMGSQLGGWITEAATGMNDTSDPYGQLARMARDRMYSEAWGWLGRSPVGHLMAGLTVLCGYGDEFAEGLGYAEQAIVRDTRSFTDNMDSNLVAFLMRSASDREQEPMAMQDLEAGIRTFYSDNSTAMASSYRVIDILRRTFKLDRDEGGMTRFVDANGHITDRAAFNTFAAGVAERELNIRSRRLTALWERYGITLSATGQVTPVRGSSFTQEQVDFLEGDGARLGSEIMRLTNALATLRPSPVMTN
ncbi:MAG TPA: hypothetical protein VLJ37_09695 [bacterium]|nr:hypothetical protein [bacterium]